MITLLARLHNDRSARLARQNALASRPSKRRCQQLMASVTGNDGMHPQSHCPLFDLPAEVRNTIYELVLLVLPNRRGTIVLNNYDSGNSVLSLLETCKLVNHEAYGIFYSTNHFEITAFSAYSGAKENNRLAQILENLSPLRLSAIQHLTLRFYDIEQAFCIFKSVRPCSGLKSLHLWYAVDSGPTSVAIARVALAIARVERERPLWKRAVYKLPASLQEVAFKNRCERIYDRRYPHDEWKAFEKEVGEMLAGFLTARKNRRELQQERLKVVEVATAGEDGVDEEK